MSLSIGILLYRDAFFYRHSYACSRPPVQVVVRIDDEGAQLIDAVRQTAPLPTIRPTEPASLNQIKPSIVMDKS